MKITHILSGILLAALTLASCTKEDGNANKLVILHTNDTHSQIEPNAKDRGGVMRRMAVIDSIRSIYPNVMYVDAGDVVQGTLYFYLYGGAVEQQALNIMGLDEGVLGNHEFDNGMDSLASILRLRNHKIISTNYVANGTALDTLVIPYSIREFNGKKIGFIGINLDPTGIIREDNCRGLGFRPIVATANATAGQLREQFGADAVVAITHIGYNQPDLVGDSILAVNSRGIDVIIGGHSHDVIDPSTEKGAVRCHMTNADGRPVLVAQTGKGGVNIGKIELNLDSLGMAMPGYELLPVDSRYDGYVNDELQALIDRYKPGVDSLMTLWISSAEKDMADGSEELLNFVTDFIMQRGLSLAKNVDLAIANKGGIRTSLNKGAVSKGQIINMLPFYNFITVVDIKGSDLKDVFEVMAGTAGNGVSANVRATYVAVEEHTVLGDVTISGKPIDPNRTYRVATIDYLAEGGDYMNGFCQSTTVATSPYVVYDDMVNYLTTGAFAGKTIVGDIQPRWTEVAQ